MPSVTATERIFPSSCGMQMPKIYSTYYTTRKDNAWAKANPDEVQQCYIMTGFYTADGDTVTIPLMKGHQPGADDGEHQR